MKQNEWRNKERNDECGLKLTYYCSVDIQCHCDAAISHSKNPPKEGNKPANKNKGNINHLASTRGDFTPY